MNIALICGMEIAGQRFVAAIAKKDGGLAYSGTWIGGDTPFSLKGLATACGTSALPDFLTKWELPIKSVSLAGVSAYDELIFRIELTTGDYLELSKRIDCGERIYCVDLTGESGFSLSDIEILRGFLPNGANITLQHLHLSLGSPQSDTGVGFKIRLSLGNSDIDLCYPPVGATELLPPLKPAQAENAAPDVSDGSGIKWIDINKSIKVLRINRIGLAMESSAISVYLDAGLNISIISLEFYELYLKIPIGDGKFDFGLNGVLVAMDLPAVKLTGGLYRDSTSESPLYNGILQLQISDFSLTAMGSYGEVKLKDGGTAPSFFAYALLKKPLGGPAFFFITGLALGFGVNREIMLPKLEEVPEFPFVKAAMGDGGLKDSPSVALNTLSNWVKPSEGSYFAAAGVKFSSFGIANSFAVLIVEFGKRTRISLLGQSVITMPPNLKRSDNPLMYAELALRAVLDIDEGYLEVIAALTDNSYILHKSCKLQGGFLFCTWFKGERKGDFMISLGGCHHPLFKNKDKYPKISKVGINWQISSSLALKGSGYLAVTSACVMAGCDVSIDYRSGGLHAWLYASASFFMQWKPLFYDVKIGVSIGVEFSISKLELNCGLRLRGPEFSGELSVSVMVVSFTIRFGAWGSAPAPLDWNQFSTSFLPQKDAAPVVYALTQSGDGPEINSANVSEGVIREGRLSDKGVWKNSLFVRPLRLRIATRSAMPCTGFALNATPIPSAGLSRPSIAPMRLSSPYSLTHEVALSDASGKAVAADRFHVTIITDNMSPAIWGGNTVDINAQPIKNLGVGLELKLREPELEGILPSKPSAGYRLSVLEDKTTLTYSWGGAEGVPVKAEDFKQFVGSAKQAQRLAQLSAAFGTARSVSYGDIRKAPMDYYWASFYSCRTGQRIGY